MHLEYVSSDFKTFVQLFQEQKTPVFPTLGSFHLDRQWEQREKMETMNHLWLQADKIEEIYEDGYDK